MTFSQVSQDPLTVFFVLNWWTVCFIQIYMTKNWLNFNDILIIENNMWGYMPLVTLQSISINEHVKFKATENK